jgi:hypothetical protein
MRVRSNHHRWPNSVDAAELLSELRLSVCLAFVDKVHPSRFPVGRSREVLGLETVVGTQ